MASNRSETAADDGWINRSQDSAMSCHVRFSDSLRVKRAMRSHSAAFARYSSFLLKGLLGAASPSLSSFTTSIAPPPGSSVPPVPFFLYADSRVPKKRWKGISVAPPKRELRREGTLRGATRLGDLSGCRGWVGAAARFSPYATGRVRPAPARSRCRPLHRLLPRPAA